MKCPVCATPDLLMSNRQGVEIDYCPQCRGVWLDRGELDKILERSAAETAPQQQAPLAPPPPPVYGHAPKPDHYDKRYDPQYGYRKKKSIWNEIFD
jgi:Zn-finger nucleic acid-binding protein